MMLRSRIDRLENLAPVPPEPAPLDLKEFRKLSAHEQARIYLQEARRSRPAAPQLSAEVERLRKLPADELRRLYVETLG
jgi:hypothetical protein